MADTACEADHLLFFEDIQAGEKPVAPVHGCAPSQHEPRGAPAGAARFDLGKCARAIGERQIGLLV